MRRFLTLLGPKAGLTTFAIWSLVVLSPGQRLIQSQGGLPSGAVADWRLDAGSGTSAQDDSGSGNHGILTNGPEWVAGRIGGALQFDGANDYVVVESPNALSPINYAISAWVRFTSTGPSGGEIATMGDNFALRVQPTGAVKTFFYAGGSNWPSAITPVTINDGNWHHVVGQYDGTNLEVWVNGTREGEVPSGLGIAYGLGTRFYLGRHGNGGANHNFNGSIDQLRVYPRALSATEIGALAAEAPPAVNVSVFTWNLRKCRGTDTAPGGSDCNRVADAIHSIGQEASVDIALLSAVHVETHAQIIRDRLNQLAGGAATWTYHYDRAGSEGQAILTRHTMPNGPGDRASKVVTTTDCPGATEHQVLVKARVTVAGHDVNVFALDQQHGGSNSGVRACQAEKFRDWAADFALPRIVGGDFNGVPGDAGITTWLNPPPPAVGYDDGWVKSPTKVGYGREDAQKGNDISDQIFGRTLRNRIDYIIYNNATPIAARVWDTRLPGTTCANLHSSGFLSGCSAQCICEFVDDKGVRPTDHIPLTVKFSIQ